MDDGNLATLGEILLPKTCVFHTVCYCFLKYRLFIGQKSMFPNLFPSIKQVSTHVCRQKKCKKKIEQLQLQKSLIWTKLSNQWSCLSIFLLIIPKLTFSFWMFLVGHPTIQRLVFWSEPHSHVASPQAQSNMLRTSKASTTACWRQS